MGYSELDKKINAQLRKTPGLKEIPEAADAIRRYIKRQQAARRMDTPIGKPRGKKKSTNRRKGHMKFNPKAKLDTRQIIDKRSKYKLSSYDPTNPNNDVY